MLGIQIFRICGKGVHWGSTAGKLPGVPCKIDQCVQGVFSSKKPDYLNNKHKKLMDLIKLII